MVNSLLLWWQHRKSQLQGAGVPELTNMLSDDPSAGGAADPTRLQLIATNQQVPTLSEWALMLLMMLMAGFAYRELKRSGRFNKR